MLSQHLKLYRREHPEDDEFAAVHLNYKSIRVIDRIPNCFAYLQELYLNHNNLATLAGVEAFLNIKIFHFRFNYVVDLQELRRIGNPFFLKSLAVLGNQLQSDPNCNKKWLRANLFRNLEEYNPPSSQYYRQQDKSTPMSHHERNNTLSLDQHEFESQRVPSAKVHNLSVSFSGRNGERTSGGTPGPYMRVKDVSLMTREAESAHKQQEQTKRFTREVLKSTTQQPVATSRSYRKIRPFDEDGNTGAQLSAQTAKFSFNNRREQVRGAGQRRITQAFVEEQTEYFADAFYYRTLCEKALRAWQQSTPESHMGASYCSLQLKLKALTALKTNVALRQLERSYHMNRQQLRSVVMHPH